MEVIGNDNVQEFEELLTKINIDTVKFKNNRTALHFAIIQEARNITTKLIKESRFINQLDDNQLSPLMITIINRDYGLTYQLLEKGVDANVIDTRFGLSALHYAIEHKNLTLIKKLVAHGALLNVNTNNGDTPLHIAVSRGNEEIVTYFLNKKISDTITNNDGETVLDYAVQVNNFDISKQFITRYSAAQKKELVQNILGNDPLRNITIVDTTKNSIVKEKQLIKWMDQKWISKKDLKETFVRLKDTTVINILLNKGIDINYISKDNQYALIHMTAIGNQLGLLKFLISKGANVNLISEREVSPLMYSVQFSSGLSDLNLKLEDLNSKLVKSQLGFNPDFLTETGLNPEITIEKNLFFIQYLIDHNANVNYVNKRNENALYYAQANLNKLAEKLLLENNSKITKEYKLTQLDKAMIKNGEKRK
jgi:ankyrin repeat protein